MFQLVLSNPGVQQLQQESVPNALPWGHGWQQKATVLSLGWTKRFLSNVVPAVAHSILVALFHLPHTTASLEWAAPKLTEYCGCGLPAGNDLLALLCAHTDQWVAAPLAAWAPCPLTQPFLQTPFLQSSASQPLTPAQLGILNFSKVLLAHFSSLSSSIPSSSPSLTVCASLH